MEYKNLEISFFSTVQQKFPFSAEKLEKIFSQEIKQENKSRPLNVILIGKHRMKSLNLKFKGKNSITDVLSFDLGDIAEIYICKDAISTKKFKEGLIECLAHGFLHLLGYNHKNAVQRSTMLKKQKELVDKILWES